MNKVQIITIFAFVGLLAFALTSLHKNQESINLRANSGNICPKPEYRTDAWMANLISSMKAINYDGQLVDFLAAQIPKDTGAFSTEQILSIFNNINFDNSRLAALKFMNPYIQSLTPENIIDILDAFSFSSNKILALQAIASTLSDLSDESKTKILDSIAFEKRSAKAILDATSPRNCLFGTINESVVAFLVGVNYSSMTQTFPYQGSTISRSQFIKNQLIETITTQLKPHQKFNIYYFASHAGQFKNEYVDAAQYNLNYATEYIQKLTLISDGNESFRTCLDFAFYPKQNLTSIYIISDGLPTNSITNLDYIKKYLTDKNANRTEKFTVNTISFMMGGKESQKERDLSFQFLKGIAEATNGTFKGISG